MIAYDPYASEVKAQALGVKLVSWEEALAQGDFFSLHMPMTPQTKVQALFTPILTRWLLRLLVAGALPQQPALRCMQQSRGCILHY